MRKMLKFRNIEEEMRKVATMDKEAKALSVSTG